MRGEVQKAPKRKVGDERQVDDSKKIAEALCAQIAVLKKKYAQVKVSKETLVTKRTTGKEKPRNKTPIKQDVLTEEHA